MLLSYWLFSEKRLSYKKSIKKTAQGQVAMADATKKLAPMPMVPLPVLGIQSFKDKVHMLTVLFPKLIMYMVWLITVIPVGVLKIGGDAVQLLRSDTLLQIDTVSFAEFEM